MLEPTNSTSLSLKMKKKKKETLPNPISVQFFSLPLELIVSSLSFLLAASNLFLILIEKKAMVKY